MITRISVGSNDSSFRELFIIIDNKMFPGSSHNSILLPELNIRSKVVL